MVEPISSSPAHRKNSEGSRSDRSSIMLQIALNLPKRSDFQRPPNFPPRRRDAFRSSVGSLVLAKKLRISTQRPFWLILSISVYFTNSDLSRSKIIASTLRMVTDFEERKKKIGMRLQPQMRPSMQCPATYFHACLAYASSHSQRNGEKGPAVLWRSISPA